MEKLLVEEVLKFQLKIRYYVAHFWRFSPETIDDFVSYCTVEWLSERRPLKTPFQFLVIDFLRKYVHRDGKHGSNDVMTRMTRMKTDRILEDLPGAQGVEEKSPLLRHPSLAMRERVVILLFYEWEMTGVEIGDLLDITESRVAQIRKRALVKLGFVLRGEKIPHHAIISRSTGGSRATKTNPEMVEAIRLRWSMREANPVTQKGLAKEYGISQTRVYQILKKGF